jgi:hypothetical protein
MRPYLKVNKTKINTEKHDLAIFKNWVEKDPNRVRSENIKRIKLPCYCTFQLNDNRPRRFGMLISDNEAYRLYEVGKQVKRNVSRRIDYGIADRGLADLIKTYKINIGKAEINYYE